MAIKAPAPVALAPSRARRHLVATPCHYKPREEKKGERKEEEEELEHAGAVRRRSRWNEDTAPYDYSSDAALPARP